MSEAIAIDNVQMEIRRSNRRRSVGIMFDREGGAVVAAPASLDLATIERIVRGKRLWLHKTLARKRDVQHSAVAREYVTGEGFFHLGRSYRLKLTDEPRPLKKVELRDGRIMFPRPFVREGRRLMVAWYRAHAKEWTATTVGRLAPRVGAHPKSVSVRTLGFRWGSCSRDGDLYFHWRVILLPAWAAEYIVLHELVHLLEHHHGPAFYDRLAVVAPDHKRIEAWLAKNAGRFAI